MIREKSKLVIAGPEQGLTEYLMQLEADTPGIIYCVGEDSDEQEHRAVANEVMRRKVPVIVVSSWEVYPEGVEDVIYENSRVSPDTRFGEVCREAEQIVGTAARESGVACGVLRPGMMFGTHIGGEGERMFREVAASRWFGLRNVDTRRTLVCALDVARVAVAMLGRNGVWNVGDGRQSRLTDLAAAMSANSGYYKRPIVLPMRLAKIIAKIADTFPFMNRGWDSAHLRQKVRSRLLDTTALAKDLPEVKFYDTLAVISRTDETYPYESK